MNSYQLPVRVPPTPDQSRSDRRLGKKGLKKQVPISSALICFVLYLLSYWGTHKALAEETTYQSPDLCFSFPVSDGMQTQRNALDPKTFMTTAVSGDGKLHIKVMNMGLKLNAPPEKMKFMLQESARPYFEGWLGPFQKEAREFKITRQVSETRLNRHDALVMEVNYLRGDADDPRKGKAIYLITPNQTYLITATAKSGGEQALNHFFEGFKIMQ